MSVVKRLWQSFTNPDLSYRSKTYIAISFLMMIYSLFYVILYLLIVKSGLGLSINLFSFVVYAVCTFFIEKRAPNTARLLQLCMFLLQLFAVTFVFSTRAGYQFYFVLVPVITLLFFEFDKPWQKFISVVFTMVAIAGFITCEIYATNASRVVFSDLMFQIIFYIGIGLIVIGLLVALWIFNVALRKAEDKLIYLSTTDVLTGAHNRRYFIEHAEIELMRSNRYENPLAILMMDIDYFKNINDQFGHQAGDDVLKAVVSACHECVRRTDYFARVGGEEFAALLVDVKREQAIMISERIRNKIEVLLVPSPKEDIHLTISIGLSFFHNESLTLSDLLTEADAELYRAKENGRNRVEYEAI